MSDEFGTLSMSEKRLWQIIAEATAGRYEKYSEMYLKASGDTIVTVVNTPAMKFTSFCTFNGGFTLTGTDELEAVVEIDDLAEYFDFVSGSGDVTLSFWGEEGNRLPTYYTIKSDLKATVYTKATESDLKENFALGISEKYNDDDHFVGTDGELGVVVRGEADEFYRIAEAQDSDRLDLSMHPFVVDGDEFRLEATDEKQRNEISGSLSVNVVSGGEVDNYYDDRYDELFSHLHGQVEAQTEQDSVLSVVKESGDDVYRHVITPAGA